MDGLGKYIRLLIAAAVGGALSFLVLKTGLPLSAEQQLAVAAFVTTAVYSVVAKWLKRFPWLDLEGYTEYLDAKNGAASLRAKGIRGKP